LCEATLRGRNKQHIRQMTHKRREEANESDDVVQMD
jgi:hypothetical protein